VRTRLRTAMSEMTNPATATRLPTSNADPKPAVNALLMAAGDCSVKWNGKEQRVGPPEVVAATDAKSAFSPALWLLLRVVGIRRYLKLEPFG
jgi:hypothetical protein